MGAAGLAGVMISMFGALNSNLLAGPRIYFAMARDGLFPAAIRHVHRRFQTPANAILAQSLVAVLVLLCLDRCSAPFAGCVDRSDPATPGDAFDALTDFVVFGGTIFYALVVAAVFVLRWKMPDAGAALPHLGLSAHAAPLSCWRAVLRRWQHARSTSSAKSAAGSVC